jgi:hypothetical protein
MGLFYSNWKLSSEPQNRLNLYLEGRLGASAYHSSKGPGVFQLPESGAVSHQVQAKTLKKSRELVSVDFFNFLHFFALSR